MAGDVLPVAMFNFLHVLTFYMFFFTTIHYTFHMFLTINRFYLTFRISAMAKRQESMRKLWQIWTLILTVGGLLHYPNKNLDWPLDGISGFHPALGWVGRGLSDGRGGTGVGPGLGRTGDRAATRPSTNSLKVQSPTGPFLSNGKQSTE